ncbi:MAG: 2-amino-4-hydroxy-6-hydroxymethyldihydropteridine diphosphokinase [Candidatus Tumulicola sp.]
MTVHRAFVGIGANVGDAATNVTRALTAIGVAGVVVRASSLYRTRPWGKTNQAPFVNAVALLETELGPRELLEAFHAIEIRMGRVAGERWGPRHIDLDLLAYDELELVEEGLCLPHRFLRERAFVLIPLAEIDARYEALRDALPPAELQGVERLGRGTVSLMPHEGSHLAERVRRLAEFLASSDAVRVRIERSGEDVEVGRRAAAGATRAEMPEGAPAKTPALRVDAIKADLVGIFHLSRPAPVEGELLEEDRELAFIEALGIRTPVRSLGSGRIVAIASHDGAAVEYGQPLFLLDRG